MSNAVKYTEAGSVTLTVTVVVNDDTANLTFRIEDTGIGIRKEDIEKLYQEFERIEEQRNRKIEGTGLGMHITTQLLERMGSRLQIESIYGKGSVFSFTLEQKIINREPVGDLEQRIRIQAEEYSYQAMFTAPDARVLIVDDNAINRKVFVKLLKATHMQVEEAAGGKECLELVRQKAYDLIFLDHMMPDMDGITVLHKMKEWKEYPCRNTPVIALTANAVTGAREMYLKEGFWDFLSKPVKTEKLEKMIMKMLPKDKVIHGAATEEDMPENKIKEDKQELSLPELEGIDWNYAGLYCGDENILRETLRQFYDGIDAEAERLEESLSKPDVRAFRIQVHSMKNSAAMIGAVSLAGVARMLEYAARDEKTDVIETVSPLFLQEWHRMKEILKPVVQKEDSNERKEAPDYELIRELLPLLKKAIEEMDVDAADEIIKQFNRFTYPEQEMAATVERLCLAVMDLDEEQTAVWADTLERHLE